MIKLLHVSLFCFICFIVFILVDCGIDKKDMHHRQRRYLNFRNMSRFFLRLNLKVNMVEWNQIFGQSLGYRLNWDDPPDSFHPFHHLHRRTVYNNLELILDKNGLNGYHCVRRAICEMAMIDKPKGVYYKILKMVFRQQSSDTDKWHNVTTEECMMSIGLCQISLLDVSLYTDE